MKTGYEISFEEFKSLLSYPYYRPSVAPVIAEWFDCEVVTLENGFVLRDSNGAEMDSLTVHERIQGDSERQGRIYRIAMTLWR
jgi:hypothetical protein